MEEKFKKFGWSFLAIFIGNTIVLPMALSAIILLVIDEWDFVTFVAVSCALVFGCIIAYLSAMQGSGVSAFTMKRTAKKLCDEDFRVSASYTSNMHIYIDTDRGKIAVISPYNPFKLQILSASVISDMEIDSRCGGKKYSHGVRLKFRIDGVQMNFHMVSEANLRPEHPLIISGIESVKELGDTLDKAFQVASHH